LYIEFPDRERWLIIPSKIIEPTTDIFYDALIVSIKDLVHTMQYNGLFDYLARLATHDPTGKGRASVPVAWASTRGLIRPDNQDRVGIAVAPSDLSVAVVADGMGGMKEGARAAALAVAATLTHCVLNSGAPIDVLLQDSLHFANDKVFRALNGDGGATIVIAAWRADQCFVGHAGDSRAYSITGSGLPTAIQITSDDTLNAELARLGRPSPSESNLHRGLVQFIGIGPELQPHIVQVPKDARGLLLTTDGAHSLPTAVLDWLIASTTQLQLLPERLVLASEWHGGKDNGTAVAIGIQKSSPAEPLRPIEIWMPGDHIIIAPMQVPLSYGEVKGNPTGKQFPNNSLESSVREKKPARTSHNRKPRSKKRTSNPPKNFGKLPLVDFGTNKPSDPSAHSPQSAGERPLSPDNPQDSIPEDK
jgi:serine/threonine protein phosphatase PrpC